MKLFQLSTKIRPLFFFESFIKKDKLMEYEDSFYNHPINPSQQSFKEKGYKEYMKDTYYGNEEYKPVRVYFKDDLKRLLDSQIFFTTKLLIDRKDELEYQNIVVDVFINKQLKIIEILKRNIENITVCKELVIEALNTLEKNIIEIGSIQQESYKKIVKLKTSNPFFEPKIKKAGLIKLYDIAVEHRIIDDEVVTEETFINVFMSNNPEALDNEIIFSANNQVATFFLNCIMPLFRNLSHSQISKSLSFKNKNGKLLNQNDLDKAIFLFNNKPKNQSSLKLEKEVNEIIPKKN